MFTILLFQVNLSDSLTFLIALLEHFDLLLVRNTGKALHLLRDTDERNGEGHQIPAKPPSVLCSHCLAATFLSCRVVNLQVPPVMSPSSHVCRELLACVTCRPPDACAFLAFLCVVTFPGHRGRPAPGRVIGAC